MCLQFLSKCAQWQTVAWGKLGQEAVPNKVKWEEKHIPKYTYYALNGTDKWAQTDSKTWQDILQ